MIKAHACRGKTGLEIYGSASEIATDLHHIVEHTALQIIKRAKPEDRKELAMILAQGMATAVKDAFLDVQKGESA